METDVTIKKKWRQSDAEDGQIVQDRGAWLPSIDVTHQGFT